MTAPYWLHKELVDFPPAQLALDDEYTPGLLAVGGDLKPERLLCAYANGIFPWSEDDSLIMWWSPATRMVLPPSQVHVSRSMRKLIRQQRFSNTPFVVSMDSHFQDVTGQCAAQRKNSGGTWITADMQSAYHELHRLGHAHSLEVTRDGVLVGGLYGVSLGRMFFGESMFGLLPNVSKLAFIALCRQLQCWNYQWLDCQMPTSHLASLGASPMSRSTFLAELAEARLAQPALDACRQPWVFDQTLLADI